METAAAGQEVGVVHIPKTIDNDLVATDHTPGYGSAARFVALATMGVGRDAESMGRASPVAILEVMGRDAGWLAASSALGKREEMDAPHFICLPEAPLDEERFLERMEDAYRRWGFAVAVAAENARTADGPVGGGREPFYVDDFGHAYFEGPGRYLAQLVSRRLKVRARFEKPGTVQRSIMACVSRTDLREARLVGRDALSYALEGRTGCMVTLERRDGGAYRCETGTAPLESVAGRVKRLPADYIDSEEGLVTQKYVEYASPLIGARLPRYVRLAGGPSRPLQSP
jgi:6-phosphofructokinase 1